MSALPQSRIAAISTNQASRIAEPLALVSLAMVIGLLLAIPLEVLAARRPVLARLALAAANGLQAIPSLALLLLLRTTVIGLQGVPAGLVQAGLVLATVAAAIGAGCLGVFMFRGIATVDHGLILAGAAQRAIKGGELD